MAKVTIYTTGTCPYCVKAKMLLQRKGIKYEEIDASDDAIREVMITKSSGKRTVPQIFIGANHIGGCDDLYALENKGELDKLIEN